MAAEAPDLAGKARGGARRHRDGYKSGRERRHERARRGRDHARARARARRPRGRGAARMPAQDPERFEPARRSTSRATRQGARGARQLANALVEQGRLAERARRENRGIPRDSPQFRAPPRLLRVLDLRDNGLGALGVRLFARALRGAARSSCSTSRRTTSTRTACASSPTRSPRTTGSCASSRSRTTRSATATTTTRTRRTAACSRSSCRRSRAAKRAARTLATSRRRAALGHELQTQLGAVFDRCASKAGRGADASRLTPQALKEALGLEPDETWRLARALQRGGGGGGEWRSSPGRRRRGRARRLAQSLRARAAARRRRRRARPLQGARGGRRLGRAARQG